MSSELYWNCIRNNNAFLVRRSGVTFSTEPGNLTCQNSFKYSGLAQNKTIRIDLTPAGVTYARRSTKASGYTVAKSFPTTTPIRPQADGATKAMKISRDLQANGYRLDLVEAAQARTKAALDSFKPRKSFSKKVRGKKTL